MAAVFVPDPRIQAVLFDLDNTLCSTDHLNQVRLRGTREQLRPHLPRLCAYPGLDAVLAELSRKLPLGVVSRAHSWYTEDVLTQIFPNVHWATVVSYDDVVNQKPHPEGLLLAAERMGLADRTAVAYLGDTKGDVEAAYHASMRPVQCTWEAGPQKSYFAQQIIPDAILDRPEHILAYVSDPVQFLPLLEARLAKRDAPAGTRRVVTQLLGQGGPFVIYVLGRYFADAGPTLHLHGRHDLSRWIDRKNEPGQFQQPRFVQAVAEAIDAIARELRIGTVTVIPAKPGSHPRMEEMLAAVQQLMGPGNSGLRYAPDLLAFSADAQRIKHFTRAQRVAELERSLQLVKTAPGERILVVDDVLTAGGTFKTARGRLLEHGAAYVAGLALTKTVSGASFEADPTFRVCPLCGREVKLIRRRDGGRFRGCVGYWGEPKCYYTENA
ncbi:MAG TPA: HAD hydrolase-like protein [Longimicrobium sp.]|jgi:beta-phosphoglucomutase-like phosphatase (HAD superfamily)/hypoxanthine-guanine phosphoribosyltransferase